MASTFTTNKNLEKPANNDDINTWDVPVNGNSNTIDTALGGLTSLNVVGISGTVALSLSQVTPPNILLTGAQSADIIYTIPNGAGGFWSVTNDATGGHNITFASATPGASSFIIIPQGETVAIKCDTTIGVQVWSSATGAGGSTDQIQYNVSGALTGSANLTFDGTNFALNGPFAQTGGNLFTTGQVIGSLLVLNGSSSGFIEFQAAATSNNVTFTLPPGDGTPGQVLSTNGSGVLAWATALLPRVNSTSTSPATPTAALSDQYDIDNLSTACTINAPSGSPVNGQRLVIRITDNGTSRTLTWNAIYNDLTGALPASTVANTPHYVGCIYNSASSKWNVVAVV